MIYVDTSVVLAFLLAEDRKPQALFWEQVLVTSRLTQYEVFNVLHRRRLGQAHQEAAWAVLYRIHTLELLPDVLKRALEPFPAPLRTLDALHLASFDFLRKSVLDLELATYDQQMLEAAKRLKFKIHRW